MQWRNQPSRGRMFWFILLLSLAGACAAVQDVRITYRVPDPSEILSGERVFLDFEDVRENRDILGPGARQAYAYHSGNVALFVSSGGGEASRVGLTNVPSLFRRTFERRIRALGGEVVSRSREATAVLVLELKAFELDLKDRSWKARMAYEAKLQPGDTVRASQTVAGEAERAKILGVKQADQVMSELFTDMVNRLDLKGLIQKSRANEG
ncbi:MAG: hypothetical protein PVG49_13130 [Desulfobacteraceae bacterium]|jgi:hypothetical protein